MMALAKQSLGWLIRYALEIGSKDDYLAMLSVQSHKASTRDYIERWIQLCIFIENVTDDQAINDFCQDMRQ